MWPCRRLCDLLKIEHPIIQAPMAGSATPQLASAVSNAGGVGSLGCGEMTPEEISDVAGQMRSGTNRAFNLNFFAHEAPRQDPAVLSDTLARLAPYYQELGLEPPTADLPELGPGFDADKLSAVLKARPPLVSFHFGLPEPEVISELKAAGIVLICSATTVAEARYLEARGIDAIIAQGWEAGGHRGSHKPTGPEEGVGGLSLVPQIASAVDLPVIAAGGIADGRGIAAAFALGASGVQMGTAFLSCPEAGTDDARREIFRQGTAPDTMVTNVYSGRAARAVRSRLADDLDQTRQRLPDFPAMYDLSGPLRKEATKQGSVDFSFHLMGQSAALNRELPAAELLAALVAETAAVFDRLGRGN
ncbi:NAD(P)H-dependent flavin oxidoreductase [Rhodovibrionaceae bacterium A322]